MSATKVKFEPPKHVPKRHKHKNGKVHNLGPLPLSHARLRAAAVRRGISKLTRSAARAIRTVIVHRLTRVVDSSSTIAQYRRRKTVSCQDVDLAYKSVHENGRARSTEWLQCFAGKLPALVCVKSSGKGAAATADD